MATKTRIDLAKSAMQDIKRLANGEELAPEDQTFVLEKIDAAQAELTELEIADWDKEEIPEAVMTSFSRVVAADIAGRYTPLAEAQYHLALRGPAVLHMQNLRTRQNPPVDEEEKYF